MAICSTPPLIADSEKALFMADLHTFLLIVVFSLQFAISSAQEFYCSEELVQSQSNQYRYNLAGLLQKLNSTDSAFNSSTMGESPDQVYGLFLCRGDATDQICQSCVHNATSTIVNQCPSSTVALFVYEYCLFRYSSVPFFGKLNSWPIIWMCDFQNITDTSGGSFKQLVKETMMVIAAEAAMGDWPGRKFATRETNYTAENGNLYALGQCSPDLTYADCLKCLQQNVEHLYRLCGRKRGGRVFLSSSCNVRYEIYAFYNDHPQYTQPGTGISQSNVTSKILKKKRSIGIVIGITVATVCLVLLFAMAVLHFRSRKAKNRTDASYSKMVEIASLVTESLEYDLSTLQIATNNFSDKNKIGKGGFGVVYKGILENGDEIAVKRLSFGSDQGIEEFKNEVILVAKLQHKNLVRLLGFCLAGEEKLLVYEFVPNKSLDYILFDPNKQAQLNWTTRHKIIVGIARGLLYLHEESRLTIIHRDLKAANILLDSDMNPKISDFGTARLVGMDQSMNETQQKAGTLGYMAPEYLLHGKFSVKSDVYSFGVLMLEIVSGKKVRSFQQLGYEDDLLSSAWKHWRDGTILEFMDSSLICSEYSSDQVMCCIQLGLLCVQHNFKKRPTMASVHHMLNISLADVLPMPQQPAFFTNSDANSSSSSSTVLKKSRSESSTSMSMLSLTVEYR
ncbi:hypothetical protein Nepgr_021320 [Nepenthes gracilis]|uniref:Cysteine-rich receptor-like protein kinase 10 n=1 Tax=Nepenthes gracilis TaxID=150966 RepID=A0AAD3SYF7_NEPGR|nr:hypothetical protein Nepgr_021320 [Nepenthes gracilis]